MNILTKIIDAFKAKNPAAYTKIVSALWLIQGLLLSSISLSEGVLQEIPLLTEFLPGVSKFLESIPLNVSGALSFITGILTTLVGSSTPGSLKPVKFLVDHLEGKILYSAGQRVFLKPKIADQLIEDDIAVEVIITPPKKLPAHENKAA